MSGNSSTGVIARIVSEKGFGFIRDDADGADRFFHRTSVRGTAFEALSAGERVTFYVTDGPKGPRAEDVRPA